MVATLQGRHHGLGVHVRQGAVDLHPSFVVIRLDDGIRGADGQPQGDKPCHHDDGRAGMIIQT